MIRKFFLLCLFSSSAYAVPTAPPPISSGLVPEGNLRLFLNHDPYSVYTEFTAAAETDQRSFKAVTLGGYYQAIQNLKLGAFYRIAYGLRHNEDWMSMNGKWSWADTNSRGESLWILDATPKATLGFISMDHWVAELKTRLINNIFDHEQTLFLRPGLTYFWLKDQQAFLNFFLQYEMQFPLNYGTSTINEQWLYFGALYRLLSDLDVGAYTALKWETWDSPAVYLAKGGTPFSLTAQSYVLGLVAVFQFGI